MSLRITTPGRRISRPDGADAGPGRTVRRGAEASVTNESAQERRGPRRTAESGSNEFGTSGFVDRRRRPTPMLSRYTFFGGRRKAFQSPNEAEDAYVDLYNSRQVTLVLVFFALTIFDAIATVYYIDHAHGSEWNPIADWMLQRGRVFFMLAKGVPTGLMLLFVMIHKNFRYGRIALAIGFGFYFLLGVYHVFLQSVSWIVASRMITGV
jgi:hypothetical protein